jgi:hypothetical protein
MKISYLYQHFAAKVGATAINIPRGHGTPTSWPATVKVLLPRVFTRGLRHKQITVSDWSYADDLPNRPAKIITHGGKFELFCALCGV